MLVLVVVGWVFFRAPSFDVAGPHVEDRCSCRNPALASPDSGRWWRRSLVCTAITQFLPNTFELSHRVALSRGAGLDGLLCAVTLAMTYGFRMSPFLYFQF